jgi:hypothetical protein
LYCRPAVFDRGRSYPGNNPLLSAIQGDLPQVGDEPNRKKTMKIRAAVILVGLATAFTLPACAQQKATVDAAIAQ